MITTPLKGGGRKRNYIKKLHHYEVSEIHKKSRIYTT